MSLFDNHMYVRWSGNITPFDFRGGEGHACRVKPLKASSEVDATSKQWYRKATALVYWKNMTAPFSWIVQLQAKQMLNWWYLIMHSISAKTFPLRMKWLPSIPKSTLQRSRTGSRSAWSVHQRFPKVESPWGPCTVKLCLQIASSFQLFRWTELATLSMKVWCIPALFTGAGKLCQTKKGTMCMHCPTHDLHIVRSGPFTNKTRFLCIYQSGKENIWIKHLPWGKLLKTSVAMDPLLVDVLHVFWNGDNGKSNATHPLHF